MTNRMVLLRDNIQVIDDHLARAELEPAFTGRIASRTNAGPTAFARKRKIWLRRVMSPTAERKSDQFRSSQKVLCRPSVPSARSLASWLKGSQYVFPSR